MSDYLQNTIQTPTPQSQPLDKGQVENSAGGFSWELDCWGRLERFLILGSEGGSYYATERELTVENIASVAECLKTDPIKTAQIILDVSITGRAPKNDPAILALAMACTKDYNENDLARGYAMDLIPSVCRTGTHLFTFVEFVTSMRGWGRSLRRGVSAWYEHKGDGLPYQLIKYRQRNGYTHRDLLRLTHAKSDTNEKLNQLFDFVTKGSYIDEPIIQAFLEVQNSATTDLRRAELIREFRLPREALPTTCLNNNEIWQALMDAGMPIGALVRNLATMTKNGLLTATSEATKQAIEIISNEEVISKSRIHPIQLLAALTTYASGRGIRGNNTWNPIPSIIDAVDEAFYVSFDNVESVGKRFLIGLDISSSMTWGTVSGVPGLTPRQCSAAMAMVTMKSGDPYNIVGFSHDLMPLNLSPRQRLDDVIRAIGNLPFGKTDCALPMIHAIKNELEVDTFIIYTDSETWYGAVHPAQALRQYRKASGIDSKLIVVGMVGNRFSIADPKDAGMLDVVGFDTAAPQLIAEFSK